MNLLQPGAEINHHYKELKTLEILDFLLPMVPRRDLDKDGIKEKVAKTVLGYTESEDEKLAFIKSSFELLDLDVSTPVSVSVIISNALLMANVETKGLTSFLKYLKSVNEKTQHSGDEGSQGSGGEEEPVSDSD